MLLPWFHWTLNQFMLIFIFKLTLMRTWVFSAKWMLFFFKAMNRIEWALDMNKEVFILTKYFYFEWTIIYLVSAFTYGSKENKWFLEIKHYAFLFTALGGNSVPQHIDIFSISVAVWISWNFLFYFLLKVHFKRWFSEKIKIIFQTNSFFCYVSIIFFFFKHFGLLTNRWKSYDNLLKIIRFKSYFSLTIITKPIVCYLYEWSRCKIELISQFWPNRICVLENFYVFIYYFRFIKR